MAQASHVAHEARIPDYNLGLTAGTGQGITVATLPGPV